MQLQLKKSFISILILLSAILCSSIPYVFNFDIISANKINYWDLFRFCSPGLFFSVYLIFHSQRKLNINLIIGFYLVLQAIWLSAFYGSLATWGLLTLIIGPATFYLIWKILKFDDELEKPKIALVGITSFIGLLFFYLCPTLDFNLRLFVIILLWQITVGITIERNSLH